MQRTKIDDRHHGDRHRLKTVTYNNIKKDRRRRSFFVICDFNSYLFTRKRSQPSLKYATI